MSQQHVGPAELTQLRPLSMTISRLKMYLSRLLMTLKKKAVRCEAEGLLRQMNQFESDIYTTFWNDILQRTDATSKNLQHAKLDLNTAVASLTRLKIYVASKRDSFKIYEKKGKELSGSSEYVQTLKKTRHRRRNVCLNPLDYGHTEKVQLSPSEKYRT